MQTHPQDTPPKHVTHSQAPCAKRNDPQTSILLDWGSSCYIQKPKETQGHNKDEDKDRDSDKFHPVCAI